MKVFCLALLTAILNSVSAQGILENAEHQYAMNDSVKIHYVTMGEGPLIVMLHGYPDFWYTWREQMKVLSKFYTVAAVDLRGYNKSGKPKGVENYSMPYLIGDVAAVIKKSGYNKAVIMGHDWGGAIAWQLAINLPEVVDKLIILSTPHPRGLFREINKNKEQEKNSEYARENQKENSYKNLTPEKLAGWVKDKDAVNHYITAFENSDIEAMLNYYKASFPKNTNNNKASAVKPVAADIKYVSCPVLALFGMEDKALLPAGWSGTWDWINNYLTLVSVPGAGHFVQHDASKFVSATVKNWLKQYSEIN